MNLQPSDNQEFKANKISPLIGFFPEDRFGHFQQFGMEIASESLEKEENENTIFDVSHFRRMTIAGLGATKIILDTFKCEEPKIFTHTIFGENGIIGRLGENKYLVVDSSDGKTFDLVNNSNVSYNGNVLFLPTDLAEIALIGNISKVVIEELTALDLSSFSSNGFLPCDLAAAETIVIPKDIAGKHMRIILDPSDAHYLFLAIQNINNRLGGAIEGAKTYSYRVSED